MIVSRISSDSCIPDSERIATTICLTWSTYSSNGWMVKMILLLNYMNKFDIRATYFLLFDISGLSQIIQPKCNCINAKEKTKSMDLPIYKSSDLWLYSIKKLQIASWRLTLGFILQRSTRMENTESTNKLLKLNDSIFLFIKKIKYLIGKGSHWMN